ncbi:MAG: zf-HC2 domain-containing protein [Anaerolineaceae bacterium]|nr:zf-HC2 domain-containing protein [Anaerolineaceae bacterium]
MSDHKKINPLLPFYLAGRLDDQKVAAVESHLAVCPICEKDLAFWREVDGAVQAETLPVSVPQRVLVNTIMKIAKKDEKLNPLARLWQILRAQVPIVHKEIWTSSLLVLLLGFVITLLFERVGFLFAIAPLISVAGLAFIFNKSIDPAFELVLSTPVSQLQILFARTGLVFGYNLVLVGLFSLGLSMYFSTEAVLQMLQAWLAPMAFLSTLGLCLSLFTKPGNAIFITYALWLSQYLPLTEEFQHIFGGLTQSVLWFWHTPYLLFGLSMVMFVFMIFWFLKGVRFTRHLA